MSDSISRGERQSRIKELEFEMFWNLFKGEDVSEIAGFLKIQDGTYFGVKEIGEHGFPEEYFSAEEGVDVLKNGLRSGNVCVWGRVLDVVVRGYDLSLENVKRVETFLERAPKGEYLENYKKVVRFNRKMIEDF